MRPQSAALWSFFGVGYLGCYVLSTTLPTPLFWYVNARHGFVFGQRPAVVAADFYGRVLWCLLAGGAAAALGWRLLRRAAPERVRLWLARGTAWCVALLLFTGALYVYLLKGRRSEPAPLPSTYVPR